MTNINQKMVRNNFIDSLKGAAILLVVWGHCIQYLSGEGFYHNPAFILIYSFHMPLFASISGYLAYRGIRTKSFTTVIKSRFKQLIVPMLIWTLILVPIHYAIDSTGVLIYIVTYLKFYFLKLPQILWFLWTLFFLSLLVAFVFKYFSDKVWAYILISILILFLPDAYGTVYIKFLFPYFVLGYKFNELKFSNHTTTILSYSSLILYIGLLFFWKENSFIYTSGMRIHLSTFLVDLSRVFFRYLIGLSGTISFIFIMKQLNRFINTDFLNLLGLNTMGIYIIGLAINPLLTNGMFKNMNLLFYNLILSPLAAIVIISFCLGIIRIIKRNESFKTKLLGG